MDHALGEERPAPFARDRLTLLVYGMAVAFGFGVAALGPAMPLLREDLDIGRTIGGLHFTALASGAVLAGLVVGRIVRSLGRRRVFWSGGVGLATGAVIIGAGWHPLATLSGSMLVGASGSAMLVVSQASLSDHHPAHRPVALTEVNTAMSVGSVIPALLIGALVAIGAGWRPAFLAPAALCAMLALLLRRETFPTPAPVATEGKRRRLPLPYWLFWAAFAPAVGAEWSVGAWGADYLVDVAGTTKGSASFLMTAFFGAMLVGRLAGGRVVHTVNPFVMLLGTTAVGLAGILLFWGSSSVGPVVAGLLIAGLGISMQFPMLLSLAMASAPKLSDIAAARVSIAAGGSVIVAPLTLGALADQVGLRSAFVIVPVLFLMVALFATLGRRADAARR